MVVALVIELFNGSNFLILVLFHYRTKLAVLQVESKYWPTNAVALSLNSKMEIWMTSHL